MATTYGLGDILLVDDNTGSRDFLGNLIRAGERSRGDGDAVWTHSAIIVNEGGDIVEALAQGVVRSHISKYHGVPTKVIPLPVTPKDPRRAYAVRFAIGQIGAPYGIADFLSLAFAILFNNRWTTKQDGQFICSELVSRAVESTTDHGFPYSPERMMPADLDRYFTGVPPLPPLGFWKRLGLLLSVSFKAILGLL